MNIISSRRKKTYVFHESKAQVKNIKCTLPTRWNILICYSQENQGFSLYYIFLLSVWMKLSGHILWQLSCNWITDISATIYSLCNRNPVKTNVMIVKLQNWFYEDYNHGWKSSVMHQAFPEENCYFHWKSSVLICQKAVKISKHLIFTNETMTLLFSLKNDE